MVLRGLAGSSSTPIDTLLHMYTQMSLRLVAVLSEGIRQCSMACISHQSLVLR